MKKLLGRMLFGIILGGGCFSAWAQCAPGGQVTSAGPGVMGGFCYYGDGSCITHPAGNIPSSCLKSAPPPLPDKWGAVAWNFETGIYDTSINEVSQSQAESVALKRCGTGCEVFTSYANQCVSAAEGILPNGNKRTTSGLSLQTSIAQQKALSKCSEKAKNCQILFTECSLPN